MRYIAIIASILLSLFPLTKLSAQHTLGVSGGGTISIFRPYPSQETQNVEGLYTGGLSWRYYGPQRFVGAVGIDLEYMQRGYSFAPYAYAASDDEEYYYYTRRYTSIMLPIIWQPHVYLFNYHVRVFLDAAATFCYNTSGTYVNEADREMFGTEEWQGDYEYKTARDNRWGYGLMGGAGITLLFGRYEIMARGRYYFGYSDILKNRNKYYGNSNDGAENPFYYTPTRSPIDNISISVGFNVRLGGGDGFDAWKTKRLERANIGTDFNYSGK